MARNSLISTPLQIPGSTFAERVQELNKREESDFGESSDSDSPGENATPYSVSFKGDSQIRQINQIGSLVSLKR